MKETGDETLSQVLTIYFKNVHHKKCYVILGNLGKQLACPDGVPSIPPVYAVTAVQNTLYHFLPDINKDVVDRVPDVTTTTDANAQDNNQDVTTTPV